MRSAASIAPATITEHPVPTPNASLRGVTVGPDGDLWYTANFANKIGRMAPGRHRASANTTSRRRTAARAASRRCRTDGCSSRNTTPALIGEIIPR